MAITLTPANSHLYSEGTGVLPNTSNPFTVNVWINATWNAGGRASFVGLYNGTPATGTPTNGAGLQIGADGGGNILCWTYGGTTMITTTGSPMTALNGTWVMSTYIWDGTNHRVYVNGLSAATPSTTSFTNQAMTQTYINGYPPTGSTNETATFSVDSYNVYARALTDSEVLTMYNNQGARGGNTYGLVSRYEFDEGALGTTVTSVLGMSGANIPLLHTGGTNTVTYTYAVGAVSNIANSNIRPVQ